MRNPITAAVVAVGLCLIVVGAALGDGTTEHQTAVKLYRGNSIIAASDPNHSTYRPGFTMAVCLGLQTEMGDAEKKTRVSGQATYKCRLEERDIITFHPAPILTCPDKPADNQRQQTCPADTVGTWAQDQIYTLQPYPDCWVQGDWIPNEPPAGMCAPIPDPDPEPQPFQAPTNVTAQGISTSAIRVTWDAVTGAGSYSLERCIGSTCTGFSQLICVQGPAGTHSSLPAGLTARYRVRARDAACNESAINVSAYSEIVSGTTLSAAAVNCVVSSWSTWTAGAWSTCSGGQQSRTETRTRTVTTQPANGGTACPVLTETRTVTQACGGSGGTSPVTLSWTPPTRNTDGSALENLAGYRISYGTTTALAQTIQLANPGTSRYTIEGLAPGTYYFAVRAYTSTGTESVNSNVISKILQ